MRFDVLTIFPGMFAPVLGESVIGRAARSGIIGINPVDIRDFSEDRHKRTDDYPYGGGTGMVMTPQPLYDAWRSVAFATGAGVEAIVTSGASGAEAANAVHNTKAPGARTIYMSPQGRPLTQKKALELSREKHLIIVCGHYEGIDERVLELIADEEISIGDYVLTGGEIPAMALIDCVSRLIPGVLPSEEAHIVESHTGGLLEYPQYTRPASFMGREVPAALLSGNHHDIDIWRRDASLSNTKRKRQDMLASYPRRLVLRNADNVRDLGGYPAKNGMVTRWRTFLRSDMLDGLTKSDIASLIDYGLSAVIDLRSKAEAEAAPDAITAADGIECHVMPLIPDAAIDNSINNAPFKELYILFAERGKRKIGKIFKTMAKSRGACLFHCYAGKDRTGVIAALLLMVAGVAPDDVVADYEISGTYFRRRYTDINADSSAVLHDKVQSYPETIEYFMKHIADNYGGAGEYLKRCGVSGDEIGAILNRFLTPYPYKAVEP